MKMEFAAFTSIEKVAEALVAEANKLYSHSMTAEFEFNGCLLATAGVTTAEQLVDQYWQCVREQSEAFQASPEGQKYAADRAAEEQRIKDVSLPGLTIYTYPLDNNDGQWKRLEAQVSQCFELWDGVKPIDACIGLIPDEWPKGVNLTTMDSPDRRFV